jgi:hypothetical protein
MRIVSRKKDYYDGVSAYGIDRDLAYIRDAKVEILSFPIKTGRPYTYPFDSRTHIIGFCGKIYPVIEIEQRGNRIIERGTINDADIKYTEYSAFDNPKPERMIHSFEALDAFMRKNMTEKELKDYDLKPGFAQQSLNKKENWKKFFDEAEKNRENESPFLEAKKPIFVISSDHKIPRKDRYDYGKDQGIIWNPLLKHFNFAKIKDPYTAFQDIRMWLSNLAAPERPMKQMTNDETAARLGHGDKYSFRKPPSNKK